MYRTNLQTCQQKENTTKLDLPKSMIEMPCKRTARYVIVETIYDAPDDTHDGAILEICEIEVFGINALN